MNWTLESLQSMIKDEVEESLSLDYKAAASLSKSDGKKAEITKDVSSFTNSAGGTIIYGIKEHDEPAKKHRPDRIDAVDRSQYSKEWLEQVINNIRPRIDNITIHPVPVSTNGPEVVYVVEIPQSSTAHQATDLRYYKRFNFESVPMYDHEIRDVMGRGQHPRISLDFEVVAETHYDSLLSGVRLPSSDSVSKEDQFHLKARAKNSGTSYAKFVNAIILLPSRIIRHRGLISQKEIEANLTSIREIFADNTQRDVVGMNMGYPQYGPRRYAPILPKLSMLLDEIELIAEFDKHDLSDLSIAWTVYADNAPEVSGKVLLRDIPIIDKRD